MKKICIALSLALLILPVQAAKAGDFFNFGVKGGLNFTNMSNLEELFQEGSLKTYTGFNAGLVFNFNLPLGFEIQPELLYQQSGSILGTDGDLVNISFNEGSLRVPINVIWGFEFFNLIKPYVFVSPYAGVGLFSNIKMDSSVLDEPIKESMSDAMNRMQYGIGLGAGIKVWKFQLSFKWNWDLNSAFKSDTDFGDLNDVMDEATKDMRFNGGELSLAIIF